MLPLASRNARAIASATSSGTCDPPGASRNAKPPCSEEKRRRTACTSSSVALMERAYLGRSEIRVSRIVLGCGNFGGIGSAPAFFGRGETREQAFAMMDAAWERGITTFDTADAYGGGRSETWIGDWLRTKAPDVREHVVLSTKTFNPMDEGEDHGLAPARIRRQLESSLRRLGVERVDMYLTHDWDPEVPVAETLGTLDELVHDGKIAAFGASNVDGTQLREALAVELPTRYEWVQNSYSLLDRAVE